MNINIRKAKEFFENHVGVTPVTAPTAKKTIPHEIVWLGQVIKLRSGKSVWNSLGSAKIALRDKVDINQLIRECVQAIPSEAISCKYGHETYFKYDFKDEVYKNILDELQRAGILEFRPVK